MANNFALTLKAQNNHAASTVIGAVTHLIPDQTIRESDLQSATFEITGTSASNTIAIGASGIVTTVLAGASAVTQKDPVTGTNLAFTNFRGVYISCDRADPDTAPGVAGSSGSNASTTSLAIGTGSKAFTVAGSLGYVSGQRVRAVSATGGGANWMEGSASYSGTTLTVTVDDVGGSGTLADWTIYAIPAAQISNTGFAFYTASGGSRPITLFEGSSFSLFKGTGTALTSAEQFKNPTYSGQTLTISLAGTTGLKVSVLVIGS
jgi:hypothetical protein